MKKFMNDADFLLNTEMARILYNDYAKDMPIVDYHCHINPQEIYEDRKFANITQVWLGGDHYKWRQMRSNGVDERYITGDATDYEKFEKWAETVEKLIGNPLYHWSHLELKKYFGYHGTLGKDNAKDVWEHCNSFLAKDELSVRNIIKASNVTVLCTTDDPIDSLEWHQKIADDNTFETLVLPTWRPDKAMNIEKKDYLPYLEKLGQAAGKTIKTLDDLRQVINERLDFFDKMGCKASDHGLNYVTYTEYTEEEIRTIFNKKMSGQEVTNEDVVKFKTAFMVFIGKRYHELGWAMQLHYGCKRDNNTRMFNHLGPDTGFDCINDYAPSEQLAFYLDALEKENKLPKTIIYSLNPNDNAAIGTIIGCFQGSGIRGKIQHGSAWWFNDHKKGMQDQLVSLANLGILPNFIGMLTDSRSFLSYTRHEYFRRILCDLIGQWVEDGEYPAKLNVLGDMIMDISYRNAMNYFEYNLKQ